MNQKRCSFCNRAVKIREYLHVITDHGQFLLTETKFYIYFFKNSHYFLTDAEASLAQYKSTGSYFICDFFFFIFPWTFNFSLFNKQESVLIGVFLPQPPNLSCTCLITAWIHAWENRLFCENQGQKESWDVSVNTVPVPQALVVTGWHFKASANIQKKAALVFNCVIRFLYKLYIHFFLFLHFSHLIIAGRNFTPRGRKDVEKEKKKNSFGGSFIFLCLANKENERQRRYHRLQLCFRSLSLESGLVNFYGGQGCAVKLRSQAYKC